MFSPTSKTVVPHPITSSYSIVLHHTPSFLHFQAASFLHIHTYLAVDAQSFFFFLFFLSRTSYDILTFLHSFIAILSLPQIMTIATITTVTTVTTITAIRGIYR
ncbi:hypothetical protein F4779DRAFT_454445 [Xylariaceae sp. FL0662B]|nr:hypothetical protein F4779DRAFT_454445 [Xylariaceae sp. FL0662B]